MTHRPSRAQLTVADLRAILATDNWARDLGPERVVSCRVGQRDFRAVAAYAALIDGHPAFQIVSNGTPWDLGPARPWPGQLGPADPRHGNLESGAGQ